MLLSNEQNLYKEMSNLLAEWKGMYPDEPIDLMRVPYSSIEALIEATLMDDIISGGKVHSGAYIEDIDLGRLLFDEMIGKIDMDEMNNRIQKGMRSYLTGYVIQEMNDYE